MTTGLSCAAASPSCPPTSFIACNNQPWRPSRKLVSHSATERPSRPLLVCSRPAVLATCSTISVEERLAGSSGLKVEQGSTEEDLRPVRQEDLRIGRLYKGKVSVVESYGVFVDIGVHVDGFVHISRLGRSLVRKEGDVMQVGQDVTVQIVDMHPRADSILLLLAPEESFLETLKLQPLTLSEREILNRAAARRAKKSAARCADTLSTRRVMSFETRQRLKAHRRLVLAERQAIQLHQVRSRLSLCETPESVPAPDGLSISNGSLEKMECISSGPSCNMPCSVDPTYSDQQ
ncbi:hypothetical protein GOP47_0022057 [Adiantum capillus-veneris]|uniref:S1 motif domain-containing protein n=1 Tax=Adiantum capillus-veneris TaxID=13818 RepID=A0A9D4U989_ADICA|nr:hypothetical protein GOP47_0022057 [Adiantum capillus-veneris]